MTPTPTPTSAITPPPTPTPTTTPVPPSCPLQYVTLQNTNMPYFNMANMPITGQTEPQCQSACNQEQCHWYNYNTGEQCWLKKVPNISSFNTGFKVPNPPVGCPSYSALPGYNIDQFDISTVPNITESECQASCNSNQNCNLYSYDLSANVCHLKQAPVESGVDTGFPIK